MTGTDEPLDYADRWLRDGLYVLRPALSVHQVSVDMTNSLARLEMLRRDGVAASTTHLLVSAAARALAANPALHQVVAGRIRHRPDRVDIGLSVSGETFVAPVLVIEGADKKSIAEIASEIVRLTPLVQEKDRELLTLLRRWGRILPFAFLRRLLLRTLFMSPRFRRQGAGTFQVSTVPTDWALASTFATAGVLVGGGVASRVVAVAGKPEVRPSMFLTLSGDHGVWDGRASARFLAAVRRELETAAEPGFQ